MYWQEDNDSTAYTVPERSVDLVFSISCRTLPVDHLYSLSQGIQAMLPWFSDEQGAGLHPIHVADSGNGWQRPEQADELLHLSRRTRLVLRMPGERIDETIETLIGRTLDIDGHALSIEKVSRRPLSTITTLFSRYIVTEEDDNEPLFLENTARLLGDMGITPRKMLPGRKHIIRTPDGDVITRSLMLAELDIDESVRLQEQGLGPRRHLGCGIFIPHKDIREVKQQQG